MVESTIAAGWYEDPQSPGTKRWWDGSQWTNATQSEASDSRNWWEKKRFALPLAALGIIVLVSALVGEPPEDTRALSALEDEVESLEDEVESLEDEVESLEDEVESLEDEVEELNDENLRLESEASEASEEPAEEPLEEPVEDPSDNDLIAEAEDLASLFDCVDSELIDSGGDTVIAVVCELPSGDVFGVAAFRDDPSRVTWTGLAEEDFMVEWLPDHCPGVWATAVDEGRFDLELELLETIEEAYCNN